MIIELGETATYGFSEPVAGLTIDVRMKALALPKQELLWGGVQCRPVPEISAEAVDCFGNDVTTLVFERPLSRLVVSGFNRIRHRDGAGAATAPETAEDRVPQMVAPVAGGDVAFGKSNLDALVRELQDGWQFDARVTDLSRSLSDIDQTRRGVCQDMCRLAVERLRQRGVPARFLVGYRIPPVQQGSLLRHAWIAARIADEWVEIDLTRPPEEIRPLIATAWGSDLAAIGPVIGKSVVPGQVTVRVVAQGIIQQAA